MWQEAAAAIGNKQMHDTVSQRTAHVRWPKEVFHFIKRKEKNKKRATLSQRTLQTVWLKWVIENKRRVIKKYTFSMMAKT